MLTIVQLSDGCYRVTVDYQAENVHILKVWTFAVAESDAEPAAEGETIRLEFKTDTR